MKTNSLMTRLASNKHQGILAMMLTITITVALVATPYTARGAGKQEVPFTGSYATRIHPVDLSTFPNLYIEISLIGRASHLGNITGTIYQNTNYSPPYFNTGTINGPTNFFASNGDRLDATFTGSFTQDANGKVTFSGEYTFNGGTGRFTDATGSAIATGMADVFAGIGYVEFSGTLSY